MLGHMSNIQAEANVILQALSYWKKEEDAAKILETDSLELVRVIKGQMHSPWEIIDIVEEIKLQVQTQQIIQHIFREGNQLAVYLANQAVEEERDLVFGDFKSLPKVARQIINTNKQQIHTLRIKTKKITVPHI